MRPFFTTLTCVILMPVFFGTAAARAKKPEPLSAPAPQNFWQDDLEESASAVPYAVGLVSWYGRRFNGRKTASGERYNMQELTCASRVLPFGTLLEVTNLANGQKAILRVNDRGPFHRKRILDVSLAAAKQLGFMGQGSMRAEIRIFSSSEDIARR